MFHVKHRARRARTASRPSPLRATSGRDNGLGKSATGSSVSRETFAFVSAGCGTPSGSHRGDPPMTRRDSGQTLTELRSSVIGRWLHTTSVAIRTATERSSSHAVQSTQLGDVPNAAATPQPAAAGPAPVFHVKHATFDTQTNSLTCRCQPLAPQPSRVMTAMPGPATVPAS